MATCKNCVHYELCRYNTYQQAKYFGRDKEIYITIDNNFACKFYRPSTDVQEVKHGEWIDLNITEWQCSECNYRVERWNNTPYCPNCGAKMDGGNKDA